MKKSECPEKLEPAQLNHEARQKLVDEISKRITLAYFVGSRDLGFARDYGEKAMIQAEGFSLEQAEKDLKQVAEWLDYAASYITQEAKRTRNELVDLVREIKESEQ